MSSPVEQIKARLSTADVVGSYLKLVRAGSNFKAVCPFHSEKSPSFFVSPARDVWHCFGCGKGGDQFRFVMEIEGVDFREALHILASRAGVELRPENKEERDERARLFSLLEEMVKFYRAELELYPDVLIYLKNRGVTDASIRDFNLGFSPPESKGWRNGADHAKKNGYTELELEKVGLIIRKEGSSTYYDRFRSRIMFPISDANGRVIGFSARIFLLPGSEPRKTADGSELAKYINTPQTVLYDKSQVLYAFDKAKVAIRKENACIVVEGQMDAVMAHQAGTTHTVAVSGTALTMPQLQYIKRLCDRLLTSFDMDDAGQSATQRSIDLALDIGFDVKAIEVPGQKDPADLIKENPTHWLDQVAKAEHVILFFLEQGLRKWNARDIEGKRNITKLVLPLIARVSQAVDKAHWVGKLASHLGVKEDAIWEDLRKLKVEGRAGSAAPAREEPRIYDTKTRAELLEERILGILFMYAPAMSATLAAELFLGEANRVMLAAFAGSSGNKEAALAALPEGIRSVADRLLFEAEMFVTPENADVELVSCVQEWEREQVKVRLESLTRDIQRAEAVGALDEVARLARQFSDTSKNL